MLPVLLCYYLCVKNVGLMCGQVLSGPCRPKNFVVFNDSFFNLFFHWHVGIFDWF